MSVTKLSTPSSSLHLSPDDVRRLIPHRYPMLMVDRVEDVIAGESAVGIKNVTANEWIFEGHFPENPIFPGVLIIEALAQTAGALVMHTLGAAGDSSLVYFMSIEEARFRKPVLPGDSIKLHVQKQHSRGMVWKFKGEARVNDAVCAEAVFTAMITEKKNS